MIASPLYAGLLALLFVGLSVRVVAGRRLHKVSVGDGGNTDLIKRMRVQANCAEYAPIGVIVLAMAELQGLSLWAVHILGIVLLAGRLSHAFGLGRTPQIVPMRKFGMYLTVGMIVTTALINILFALI